MTTRNTRTTAKTKTPTVESMRADALAELSDAEGAARTAESDADEALASLYGIEADMGNPASGITAAMLAEAKANSELANARLAWARGQVDKAQRSLADIWEPDLAQVIAERLSDALGIEVDHMRGEPVAPDSAPTGAPIFIASQTKRHDVDTSNGLLSGDVQVHAYLSHWHAIPSLLDVFDMRPGACRVEVVDPPVDGRFNGSVDGLVHKTWTFRVKYMLPRIPVLAASVFADVSVLHAKGGADYVETVKYESLRDANLWRAEGRNVGAVLGYASHDPALHTVNVASLTADGEDVLLTVDWQASTWVPGTNPDWKGDAAAMASAMADAQVGRTTGLGYVESCTATFVADKELGYRNGSKGTATLRTVFRARVAGGIDQLDAIGGGAR